jgi:hypothetical protein
MFILSKRTAVSIMIIDIVINQPYEPADLMNENDSVGMAAIAVYRI